MTIPFRHTYDPEAHTGYVKLRDGQVAESLDLGADIVMDLDADRNPIGFELLIAYTDESVKRWADALALLARGDNE